MGTRLEFQEFLETMLGIPVYFQPPSSIEMSYPCIVYRLSKLNSIYANNNPYINHIGYDVTLIDKDPDTTIKNVLLRLPKSRFERFFPSDSLNHFVFQIFF